MNASTRQCRHMLGPLMHVPELELLTPGPSCPRRLADRRFGRAGSRDRTWRPRPAAARAPSPSYPGCSSPTPQPLPRPSIRGCLVRGVARHLREASQPRCGTGRPTKPCTGDGTTYLVLPSRIGRSRCDWPAAPRKGTATLRHGRCNVSRNLVYKQCSAKGSIPDNSKEYFPEVFCRCPSPRRGRGNLPNPSHARKRRTPRRGWHAGDDRERMVQPGVK